MSGAIFAVCLDDLLMVASRDENDAFWAAIASKVSFDEDQNPIGKLLGAHHVFKRDSNFISFTVEMKDFMKDAAAIYATKIGSTKLD